MRAGGCSRAEPFPTICPASWRQSWDVMLLGRLYPDHI